MAIRHQLTLFTFLMTMAGPSLSMGMSSTIPLNNGNIAPGGYFQISTEKLYSGYNYVVSCKINNSNVAAERLSDFSITLLEEHTIWVDASIVERNTNQKFKSAGSTIEIKQVEKNQYISIQNLDFTDTYAVSDCKAALY